jgi:predicted thioesterase
MIGIGRVRRTGKVGAVMLVLLVVLAGCGKIATNDSVEEQVKSQLGTDSADCPSDLKGEVGQSIVCKATRGDQTFDVKVTVTSVDGNTINFDIERVGGTPTSSAPASSTSGVVSTADPSSTVDGKNVAQSVFDQLAENGKQVDKVSCPDLAAQVGATQRCSLVSGTETYGVTVTVTSVQGTDVKFDIQVDQQPQ